MWLAKNECTYNVSLFGADFRQKASYFFENEAGQAATVNGARCSDTITQFFLPKLDDIDVANTWFQQDDATCHTTDETIQLPHETFPGRVLSRFGDQNWPPRSCDLTPLDFFLWGYLKSKVYVNNPTTTYALQEKIKHCINEIQLQLCRKIWTKECICARCVIP